MQQLRLCREHDALMTVQHRGVVLPPLVLTQHSDFVLTAVFCTVRGLEHGLRLASVLRLHLRTDERLDGLIRNQRYATFSALIADADELEPAALLGAVIERARESKVRVTHARLGQPESQRSQRDCFRRWRRGRRWHDRTSTTCNTESRNLQSLFRSEIPDLAFALASQRSRARVVRPTRSRRFCRFF
jgi:hypothetical protein